MTVVILFSFLGVFIAILIAAAIRIGTYFSDRPQLIASTPPALNRTRTDALEREVFAPIELATEAGEKVAVRELEPPEPPRPEGWQGPYVDLLDRFGPIGSPGAQGPIYEAAKAEIANHTVEVTALPGAAKAWELLQAGRQQWYAR